MSAIELCCLDMAGTTVEDDGAVEGAFLDALSACGISSDDPRRGPMLDYVRETMGTSKITVFRALFPVEEAAQAANGAFEAAYSERVAAGEISEIPGAAEAITALRESGIRVALLTGFSAVTRDRLVDALGWGAIADLLVCPEEAGRGRPHPDMVLHALLRLGASAVSRVCVVGDTASDMASGVNAGAGQVVGVLSGADDEQRLVEAGATLILPAVTELPAALSSLG